jgi:hypothetical protein
MATKRRADHHMKKFKHALDVALEGLGPQAPEGPARIATRAELDRAVRKVQRRYQRFDAADRAISAHRKALDDGIARTGGLAEKPPGVTQLLCRRMWDVPWCRAMIDPWLAGKRTLSHAEIDRMASFVANKWGEPKPLPKLNTIRRQLARQFQKRVKSSGADALTT